MKLDIDDIEDLLFDGDAETMARIGEMCGKIPVSYAVGDDYMEIFYGKSKTYLHGLPVRPNCERIFGRTHSFS